MHYSATLKHWKHHFHDAGNQVVHYTSYLFHEKRFWSILGIVVLMGGILALIEHFGYVSTLQNYRLPTPYAPYY